MTTDILVSEHSTGDINYPLLHRLEDSVSGSLRLVEFLKHLDFSRAFSEGCIECGVIARDYLLGQQHDLPRQFYCLATSGWSYSGAVARKRGLWGTLDEIARLAVQIGPVEQHQVSPTSPEIAFTGAIEFDPVHLPWMLEQARLDDRLLIIFSSTNWADSSRVKQIHPLFFDAKGRARFEWTERLWRLCPEGNVVLRPFGGFDDMEVGLQVISFQRPDLSPQAEV